VSIINNIPSKLYIVHCVDTEGPLYESLEETFIRLRDIFGIELDSSEENLLRIQNQEIDFGGLEGIVAKTFSRHFIEYNDTWDKIDLMLSNIMSYEYRNKFLDSLGKEIIYNWHCLDHVGFESNIRRRDIGYGNIFKHYRKKIKEYNSPDKIHWHFHPLSFSKAAHQSSTSYDNSYEILHQILSRRLIDNEWFPVVNRAGFHAIRQDSSFFLEQWIPFDYSNQSLYALNDNKSERESNSHRFGDWSRAPKEWIPYNPSYSDYQTPGSMNRHTTKCLNIGTRHTLLSDDEIEMAFQNSRDFGAAILSFTNHDWREMSDDIDDIYSRIHDIGSKYQDVSIINSDALDAMQKILFNKQEIADNKIILEAELINVDNVQKVVVNCKNGSVFGSQPYLAIRTTKGQYYHDNLYEKEFKKSWEYIFDESSIHINEIDKVSIAVNDKYGNQSIVKLNMTFL
jgi:hypothetical protein